MSNTRTGKDALISALADAYRTASGTDSPVKAGALAQKIAELEHTVNTKGIIFCDFDSDSYPQKALIKGITELPRYVLSGNESSYYINLKSIESDTPLVTIPSYMCSGCSSLLSIDELIRFADYIGTRAFASCTSLTEVTFSKVYDGTLTSAFSGCDNLLVIRVPWSEGHVPNAPWGAVNAEIIYDYTGDE